MIGLGYRRDMADWDLSAIDADFIEVAPENWVRRDRSRLHDWLALGKPIYLHGVSLNLGGTGPIDTAFVRDVGRLIDELGSPLYSDHLAASGDAHQLHDLFPIPFTRDEAWRVADRISEVQDILGRPLAIENPTWYTNVGPVPEPEFLSAVAERAQCQVLLDLNNLEVNFKNHGLITPADFIARVDPTRLRCLHVAGHEFDARFGLHVDTHSEPMSAATASAARALQQAHGLPILLERDHDIPALATLNEELACLRSTTT
ncbi:MAG: hypothetical protein RI907_360 [Pseudomonadota bacterium]|jgi:uncharacterized protein (UPF0276 family)